MYMIKIGVILSCSKTYLKNMAWTRNDRTSTCKSTKNNNKNWENAEKHTKPRGKFSTRLLS